ncbi:MAG: tetratricopeptide repeat protein [Planctomycetes bacterium]|nr:tetratricopeptide repeat protein [Planctomycetota bacterium]
MSASRLWPYLLLLVCLAAAGAALLSKRPPKLTPPTVAPTPAVPNPPLAELEAPVQEILAASRKGVVEAPASANAWGWYAAVLDAHQYSAEAQVCYRRARELAPRDKRFAYNYAILLDTLGGEPERSIELLRIVEDQDPGYPPVHVRMAHSLSRKGDAAGSAAEYRRALELDPALTIARRGLGRILLDLEQFDEAQRELDRVVAAVPGDGPTHAALAQLYTEHGETERAAAASKLARDLPDALTLPDPLHFIVLEQGRSARLATARAEGRMLDGDFAGAAADYEIVLRTRAQDPKIHERLAQAYQRLGKTARAQAELAEAKRLREKP